MLNNLKIFLQEKKKLVQFFLIITGFTVIFSVFFTHQASFFKADLLNVFEIESLIGGDGYDIFIGDYKDIESQGGSIRLFAGKDLKNIHMINFDLSYNSSEIFIKQELEGLFGYFDFQDILVDQDLGKAKITLMSSEPVNINKDTAFLKLETYLKKLDANSKISIKIENIQFVDDSMKFFAGMGKRGDLEIGNTDIVNSTKENFLSISKNFCEIGKNSGENLCEIKFFGNNIENFSGSIAGQKFSLDGNNKINFDFFGKNEGIYDAFISSGNTILKLENAIYLAKSDEDLGGKLNNEITVLSDKSYTVPAKVLNNNSMTVDLWAQIDSPNGVNLINKVTANLSVLGGSPVAQMEEITVVDNKVWFKLSGVKVLQTTSIGEHTILLTAEDTEGNTSTGEIVVNVTNDLMVSAAPELSGENIIYNKTTRQIDVFVKVTDDDGINDISSVNVDLTSLGLGYKKLYALSQIVENSNVSSDSQTNFGVIKNGENAIVTQGEVSNSNNIFSGRTEKKSEIFRLQSALKLPSDIKFGDYKIVFTVFDKSGEEANLIYNYSHKSGSAPEFVRKVDNVDDDYDMDYVRLNRYKIPNDYETTFDISTIVKDEDGAGDIVEVRADLTGIGGDVELLERQGEILDGVNVKSSIFNLKGIRIPPSVRTGWHEFQLVAYDKQGNETAVTVEIQVLDPSSGAFKNSRDTIKINSEKAYNEPNLAINDGKTTFTMNVFIENQGHEIEDVILNFGNIAKYIGGEENSSSENCKNQNERIVCMKHSVKEGTKGQWFVLNNIVIPENTKASIERYTIKTIAIQKGGRAVEGFSYITVSDGTLPEDNLGSPKLQLAIAKNSTEVQMVFTNPLNKNKIIKSNFKIANTNDDSDQLAIRDIKVNTDATIVTITTSKQHPGKNYTVIANAEKLGLKNDSFTDNHKVFYGYTNHGFAPNLLKIETISKTKIALIFDQGILPDSLEQKGVNFKIYEKSNKNIKDIKELKEIKVLTKEFSSEDNRIIYLSTEDQIMNKKYLILIKNIVGGTGIPFGKLRVDGDWYGEKYYGEVKEFIGYNNIEEMHASSKKKSLFELSNSVQDKCIDFRDFTMFSRDYVNGAPSTEFFDYNFDNKIDFMDFTIFSKQYGKCEEVEKIKENKEGFTTGNGIGVDLLDNKNELSEKGNIDSDEKSETKNSKKIENNIMENDLMDFSN